MSYRDVAPYLIVLVDCAHGRVIDLARAIKFPEYSAWAERAGLKESRRILISALRALAARRSIDWAYSLVGNRPRFVPVCDCSLDTSGRQPLFQEEFGAPHAILIDVSGRAALRKACGETPDPETARLVELLQFLVAILDRIIRRYFVECRWRDHPYRPEIVQEGFLILHSFHPPEAETALQGPFAYGCVPVLLAA